MQELICQVKSFVFTTKGSWEHLRVGMEAIIRFSLRNIILCTENKLLWTSMDNLGEKGGECGIFHTNSDGMWWQHRLRSSAEDRNKQMNLKPI